MGEPIVNDLSKRFERKTCPRCGGSGHYSWCQRYGSTCFECGGKGSVLTKRGHAAAEFLYHLREARLGDVVVGDILECTGITVGGDTFRYWAPVVAVETRTDGTVEVRTEHKLGHMTHAGSSDSVEHRRFNRPGEKKAALEKTFAYQMTLAPSGKPVRLKKDGTPYAPRKPRTKKPAAPKPPTGFVARYAGRCERCGKRFEAGTWIMSFNGTGGWAHTTCPVDEKPAVETEPKSPSRDEPVSDDPYDHLNPDSREYAEREYQKGLADGERYLSDKRLYGEELAEQWEIERELREGDY